MDEMLQQRHIMFEGVNRGQFIMSSLSEMQKANQLCDVTLETEDGEGTQNSISREQPIFPRDAHLKPVREQKWFNKDMARVAMLLTECPYHERKSHLELLLVSPKNSLQIEDMYDSSFHNCC